MLTFTAIAQAGSKSSLTPLLWRLASIAAGAVILLALVALAVVGGRRAYHYLFTRRFLRDHAAHYELQPQGERPTDLQAIAVTIHKALSDLQAFRHRRAVLSIHRWSDGRVIHLGVTIAGVRNPAQTASQIARAVGCAARELATCPLPETAHLAYAYRSSFSGVSSLGDDLAASPNFDALAVEEGLQLSEAGGPAFVTMSVKPISTRERDALREWRSRYVQRSSQLAGISATNPWFKWEVLGRGMVVAGASSASVAGRLTNVGPMLPSYESGLRAHAVADRRHGAGMAAAVALAGAVLAVAASASHRHDGVEFGAALVGIGVLAGVVAGSNRAGSAHRWMDAWVRAGVAPVPHRPFLSWVHGLHGGAQRAGVEERQRAEWHPYRMARRALVLAPNHIAVATALPPLSDTSGGVTTSRSVCAPIQVRDARGSRLGFDEEGWGVQVPDSNRSSGTMVIGDPGQGKSTILLWVFASDLVARLREWREQRRVRRAVIWLETKGEGAGRALAAARRVGYELTQLCFIDVTAESGPQLDLVDRTDPFGSAEALAEAMRYAFSDRSIMDESEDILKIVFALALTIPDDLLVAAREDPAQGFMSIAFKLLGGDPVTGARERILSQISQRLGEVQTVEGEYGADFDRHVHQMTSEAASTPLGVAYRAFKSKERSRKSDTESLFGAPRNKVSKLLAATSLWTYDPGRPHISFRQILERRMAVVINFGSKDREAFTDELRARLGAVSTYLLWQAVKQECDGWNASGDSVAIFADELADISGTGGDSATDVVRLMHDGGRTRGVWPTFATQRLTQLPSTTIRAVRSFDTKIYLRLEDYEEAGEAARDISGTEDGSFTEDDVRRLPPLVGIARVRIGDSLPPAFTIHVELDDGISPGQIAAPALARAGSEELGVA